MLIRTATADDAGRLLEIYSYYVEKANYKNRCKTRIKYLEPFTIVFTEIFVGITRGAFNTVNEL